MTIVYTCVKQNLNSENSEENLHAQFVCRILRNSCARAGTNTFGHLMFRQQIARASQNDPGVKKKVSQNNCSHSHENV